MPIGICSSAGSNTRTSKRLTAGKGIKPTRLDNEKEQTKNQSNNMYEKVKLSHIKDIHSEPIINVKLSPSGDENTLLTPRKKKATNEIETNCVTPPKQKRENIQGLLNSPSTPSSLFRSLSIISPKSKYYDKEECEPRTLCGERNVYQNARRALHGSLPAYMPGREAQLLELRNFIMNHLSDKRSGTLYISGPPGTGKTASLSTILNDPEVARKFEEVYVNCTNIKSSVSIFSRIIKELKIKGNSRTEKDCLHSIEDYLNRNQKMILLVLDEIDQLESKKQSVLYTIFEWPSRPKSQIILIGIANALDLTDRILPRLQARCELKPKLMHFTPYTKQEIITIFMERLKEAGVSHVFNAGALQMLAGKVAAISGDVRRALDIGRRVIELVEQNRKQDVLRSLQNIEIDGVKPLEVKAVELGQVVTVLNNIYGTANNFDNEEDDALPLQQKLVLCSLLMILKNAKNKDVTIGKLHDAYKKVCSKQNIMAIDQAEFVGLCSLIETRGVIRVSRKKEPRLHKVHLEWDQEEVNGVLGDKKMLSVILQDTTCLGKI